VKLADLGRARCITIDKDNTTIEEGIVPGGGVVLLRCVVAIDEM